MKLALVRTAGNHFRGPVQWLASSKRRCDIFSFSVSVLFFEGERRVGLFGGLPCWRCGFVVNKSSFCVRVFDKSSFW